MSQNDPKTTSLMTSVTKNPHPQPKIFFRVQSTRLADLFEPLELFSSAIGGGARALVRQLKTAVFQAEIEVRIYHMPALKVLIKVLNSG